jgi:hypothetical protein
MDARTVVDVERWESRPFGGGYDGLHDLANREFSGCVVAGNSYLFMVRGRTVGVFDYIDPGTDEPSVESAPIDRFEDADGTAYEAPHDALALLFAMAAGGGETRGQYYSQKTPIEEVDRTLQDGGFTGYVELSENVLSGDYYLVYHGGRRRSVAYVGQSRRLKTDEEAFDLAADEVGIYEVKAVGLSTVEIPGRSGGGAVAPDSGSTPIGEEDGPDVSEGAAGSDGADANEDPHPKTDASGSVDDGGITERDTPVESAESPGESAASGPEIDLDAAIRPEGADDSTDGEPAHATDSTDTEPTSPSDETLDGEGEDDSGGVDAPDRGDSSVTEDASRTRGVDGDELAEAIDEDVPEGADTDDTGADEADDATSAEAEAETGTGTEEPAVEPAVSAVPDDVTVGPDEESPDAPSAGTAEPADGATEEDAAATAAATEFESESEAEAPGAETDPPEDGDGSGPESSETEVATGSDGHSRVVPSVDPERTARGDPPDKDRSPPPPDRALIDGETVSGLRAELAERGVRIEELRERLSAVEAERDELAERVERLEERLAESGTAPLENTRELSPAEALSGTSVLLRYRSKSEPTLAEAHEGTAERETLARNLTLETHPTFDTEGVTVSGRTFEAFIEDTQGYRFLEWLVEEFPFEVRETESVASLEPLYDALPALDRVEFDATVTLEGADRETARFDLVGRDRRGNPLLVAHLEDDHAPTAGPTMEGFVTEATAAAESHDTLVAAFAVTSSYFEPAALTVAGDAAGGSLLSRSKRKSFVKTSRRGGYHLCLVEDREESFYLSVPEL